MPDIATGRDQVDERRTTTHVPRCTCRRTAQHTTAGFVLIENKKRPCAKGAGALSIGALVQ
ncbi:hypothetical protein [Xanthomonas sp. F4]